METNQIVQIVIACLMALIIFYLIILYIKRKEFKAYSCYNIILMSIVLFLDCLLKIFPEKIEINNITYEGLEFFVSLIRTFFDKMILSVLALQVVIVYIGIIHTEYYYSHEKSIFIIGDVICIIASGALAFINCSIRWVKQEDGSHIFYEYEDDVFSTGNEISKRITVKKILEAIFCGIIFFVNVFFLIVVISHISKKRKEARAGLIEDLGYGKQLLRFSFIFTVNTIAIIVAGVIINFISYFGLDDYRKYSQIIYLIICFVIDLCFMVNKTVYQETVKLFCKEKYKEKDEDFTLKSSSTFDQIVTENNDNDDDDEDDN